MVAIEPGLKDPPDFALHVAEEAAVEPRLAAELLVRAAEKLGALVLRQKVTGLVEKGGAVCAVAAGSETIAADEVVLAAGAGTAALAATLGIQVPMSTPAGLLVHSRPHLRLLNGLVIAPRLHMRQTLDGRIVAGTGFGGGDPGDDPAATAAALFSELKAMLLRSDDLALDFHTIGYRPTPADGFPIVGRVGAHPGLYLAVMHSGVTLAAAIGRFAADEIIAEHREPLLAPYAPDRFA